MIKISCGGTPYKKMDKYTRKWIRFWARRSAPGFFGRISSRLATMFAPPHMGQIPLAYQGPNGYIDATVQIHHTDLQLGNNVYIAPRVIIYQNEGGKTVELGDKVSIQVPPQ